MTPTALLTRENLRTPKAAAIAGMVFSLLTVAVFWLLWKSVPADPQEPGLWLTNNSNTVALGLNLVPFAGIAFLWFIGVLRDRLGEREDRFFATVFFGSGILSMLFAAAAMVGAVLIAFSAQPNDLINSATFHFVRGAAHTIMYIYMIKMAAVFMFVTSTIGLRTGFLARWVSFAGFAAFVALKMLREGADGWYQWDHPGCCAVAQYLDALGVERRDWYPYIKRSGNELVRELDLLAQGHFEWPRDARGRFVSGPIKGPWTWGALFERIKTQAKNYHYVEVETEAA